jgi:hypothetical protein
VCLCSGCTDKHVFDWVMIVWWCCMVYVVCCMINCGWLWRVPNNFFYN